MPHLEEHLQSTNRDQLENNNLQFKHVQTKTRDEFGDFLAKMNFISLISDFSQMQQKNKQQLKTHSFRLTYYFTHFSL